MLERLFVYGTLAPQRANAHVLAPLEGMWEEAMVRGRLEHAGWGADMGYPGLVVDETGELIGGFLFSSSELSHFWEHLDRFEGDEYARVEIDVILPSQQKVSAYTYALKKTSL